MPLYSRRSIVAAGAATFASACRRSTQKTIAVVPKATSHLFFVSVHAGAAQAARDFHVNILWNGPNNETDFGRQIEIVEAMIARRVDGLAISATDENALAGPVERAIHAGIPATVFDSGVNVKDYVSFIETDNHDAGRKAARVLASLVHGRGKVAMVMQKPGGTSTGLRERGFEETMRKEFPGIVIAARQFGMADRARSRSAAEDILTAHPDLAGIFASSEAASIGAIQAIRARGLSRKIRLVTFDTSDEHLQALRDGTADVMFVQDAYRIGYEAVKSVAEKLQGATPPRRIELPAHVIVKADLDKPAVKALLSPQWLAETR